MQSFTHGEHFVLSRLLHAPQFRNRRFKNMQVVSLTQVRGFANDHSLESIAVRFPNIRTLDMTWCHLLSGTGLRCISHLASLEVLRVNGIRNFVPSEFQSTISNLVNLRELSFDFCYQLDGLFYDSFSRLTALRTLSLECCVLLTSSSVEETFENMHSLTSLNLSGCSGLGNRVLSTIGRCMTSLTHLDISYTNCFSSFAIENMLVQLPNLSFLDAGGNSRSGNLSHLRDKCPSAQLRLFV
jgi:hypothetical protein